MDNPPLGAPRRTSRRLWSLALVPVAAFFWVGLTAHRDTHPMPWQHSLDAFRDDGNSDIEVGKSPMMSDVIIVRTELLYSIKRGRPMKFSPAQDRLLIDCLNGPIDELAQSESLDAFAMAQRAGVLSPAEADKAVGACLDVLGRNPPYMVRLEAARFLSGSKDSRGIAALPRLVNDPVPKIRDTARRGLAQASLPSGKT